jgi:hypothetical protein
LYHEQQIEKVIIRTDKEEKDAQIIRPLIPIPSCVLESRASPVLVLSAEEHQQLGTPTVVNYLQIQVTKSPK